MTHENSTNKKGVMAIGIACICYLLLMAALPMLLNAFTSAPLATHWITSTYRVAIPFVFIVLLAFFTWFYDLHIMWFGAAFIGMAILLTISCAALQNLPDVTKILEFGLKNNYVYVLAILSVFAWQSRRKIAAIAGALAFALIVLMMPISLLFGATSFVAFQIFYLKNWLSLGSASLMLAHLCYATRHK